MVRFMDGVVVGIVLLIVVYCYRAYIKTKVAEVEDQLKLKL